MKIGSERGAVQNPLIRYATEMGWHYLVPEEAERLRRGETGLILRDIFINQVQRLNPGVVDHLRAEELIKRIERISPTIEGNLAAWEYLMGLKTIYVAEEKRERNVRLIDFKNWEANTFHVTDEFRYTNGTHSIRADVVFLINGVPMLIVETKSATKLEGIAEALDQLRRYHREGPELMALLQLFTLTHLIHFYYGATWNLSRKNLFNWRDESAGQDFETLVKTFIHPQRILRVLSDYILFTRKDDELTKVVLRPHQMRAVARILKRAADKEKRRGLIWHTQGSGKTFTMITAAKKLIEEPLFENPTVLMLVDRNELETQLFGNLAACGFSSVEVARSKRHLRELLSSDRRGLIVSMIHKFEGMPANINPRHNIFVLVDEAHRTTGGDLGNYLMGALPNATYIGFTGTPIDKTAHGKGTFKIFGIDDPKGYLDKYSIAESIADGTTVPLHYTLAPNELRVDRETLEEEFLNLMEAEGVSDVEELNKILDKAVTLKNMLKNRERVERIAEYVANHYREFVEPMGYKAFLVAVDREACTLYKEALDRYLPPEYSEVVISKAHNDPPELARYHLSDEKEKRIRKSFRKPDELPKILIVTEKLLTGYDAPVLYCMYLDKPMRDHVLLQAIARVNRPYEDENGRQKPAGFVLDFVGIFEKLEKALEFDSQDVEGTIQDLDLLKEHFAQMMADARKEFLSLITDGSPDKAAEKVLEHFRDQEKRHDFYRFFKELANIYEILSPDSFLREYLGDYDQLARMYRLLRSAYEPGVSVERELTRKTARLVQEHTQSGTIKDTLDIYEINEELLEKISQSNENETVKVFNILKSIEHAVAKNVHHVPYLITIGERAEQIARAYQERQLTTQEALRQLEELIREYNEAEKARAEKNLSPDAFAVFWLLKREGVREAERAAEQMADAFTRYPHWQTSDAQNREVRKELYKTLLAAGVKEIKILAERILAVIRRVKS
ncbi:type I restriction endonuclease subunit R [Calderihabitans maritimus]|uniref:Type I restriction enzyme endonuclease subunit n=1 Tax=Calderihabitans maritimus TaxID=1246530 RepID=A0A1Z5HU16_9FIRM|nr:type I restriction endonuclease subunit R [Calderihabitans maritimus]GAW92770.1 HsdR family type I site-specific deoxyribonuclease [Calderihabitans maritimus]